MRRTPSLILAGLRLVGFLYLGSMMNTVEVKSEQRTGDELDLVIPIAVDQMAMVECESLVSPDGSLLWLQWESLSASLKDLVIERIFFVLFDVVDVDGFIELNSLKENGLRVEFEMETLEVTLEIPPKLRKLKEISLGSQRSVNSTVPVSQPSDWSGYLNVQMQGSQAYGSSAFGGRGLEMHALRLEPVLNYRNWVMEAQGTLDPEGREIWTRQSTRFIRDIPNKRTRYALGDIRPSTVAFQDPVMLTGLSINRENRMQPFRHSRPGAHTQLFLEKDSEVEVFVNGERVRQLQLAAGPYRLQDLHLSGGSTDVEVLVRDQFGVEKRIDLSFAFDQALLAVGESDFSYSMGFRPESGQVENGYEFGEPVLSAYRRSGRSDVFTGGWNFQTSREVGQLGADGIWATKWGAFRGELSGGYAPSSRFGYAIGMSFLRYSNQKREQRDSGQWRADLYHYSPRFRGLDSVESGGSPFDFRIGHSRQLLWGLGASFGLGFQKGRRGSNDQITARASFSKRFRDRLSGRFSMSGRTGTKGEMTYGVSLRLEWALGAGGRHRFSSGLDSRSRSSELQYAYSPESTLNAWRGSASLRQGMEGELAGDVQAGYIHHRSEFDFAQSVREGDGDIGGVTKFQLGSSLAFAGGQWAVSRPIRDSFALVTGHESLRGMKVNVNELSTGAEAQLNRMGPAVVADVQSYYPRAIGIEPPDELEFGYDLGPSVYSYESVYRSGTRIMIGSEPLLFASGHCEDSEGSPFSLQVGEVRALDDETAEPQTVFTSREGAFTIEGLRSGAYEIQWFDEDVLPSRFSVPVDAAKSVELEKLVVLLREGSE